MTEGRRIKSEIVALSTRLETLIGNVNFRSDYDRALDSPEQLLAIGEHNLREYAKIEDMDEERQERIQNIVLNILAQVLQKESMEQYGNTDEYSVRRTLRNWCSQPENREYRDRIIGSAKQGMANCNLTDEQLQYVNGYLDKLPDAIIDILAKETGHLHLLPRSNAHSIAVALTDMVKEAGACYR